MTDFQFVVTILSSAGVSGLLVAALVFLSKSWLTERLKNAIAHEYAEKLETHKSTLAAQQQVALEQIRLDSSREIERLRHEHQIEVERLRSAIQAEAASDERIRSEVIKWANPILDAVQMLEARLGNIVEHEGYLALNKGFKHQQWSMTYDYFMSSTLYAFAAYFCWVRMLEERMSFEMFRVDNQKVRFFGAFESVADALRSYPPPFACSGTDAQIFVLQQRAIGELVARENNGRPACMSYDEFETELTNPANDVFEKRLAPVRALLEGLRYEEGCRWVRLAMTLEALRQLKTVCREILNIT